MAHCSCSEGPRCEFSNSWCDGRADWSVMVPLTWKLPLKLGPKFVCNSCWEYFKKAWNAPIKGIDRPENAPGDWRASLTDMMRHAQIAESFENRNKRPPPAPGYLDDYWRWYVKHRRFTPAQIDQFMFMRDRLRRDVSGVGDADHG